MFQNMKNFITEPKSKIGWVHGTISTLGGVVLGFLTMMIYSKFILADMATKIFPSVIITPILITCFALWLLFSKSLLDSLKKLILYSTFYSYYSKGILMNLNNLNLKYLIRSHTIIGVFVVFIFFLSAFFGTIVTFKPSINAWENSSKHFSVNKDIKLDLDASTKIALEKLRNPTSNIKIDLPSVRQKAISVKYGFSEKVYVHPETKQNNRFF